MTRSKPFEGRRMCLRKAPRDHTLIGLCIMYCGTGYRGMQLQTHAPTHHTVEGTLIQALKDIGLIDGIERGRIKGDQHHFARSCRTDRGVHAVRNIVSLFVPTERLERTGGCKAIGDKLNAVLPMTLRVACVSPLMGSFIPRFCCNRRVYRYLLPAYALIAPCDSWKSFFTQFPGAAESLRLRAQQKVLPGQLLSTVELSEDEPWIAAIATAVQRANELLRGRLSGTHRFHNFSVDTMQRGGSGWNRKIISPTSNESVRSIHRCEIAPRVFLLPHSVTSPTLAEYEKDVRTANLSLPDSSVDDFAGVDYPTPFLIFQIEGSSFLFNMIRKIVGILLAVLRGSRETLMDDALSPERRLVCPLAPGPYLYLFCSSYSGYDRAVHKARRGGGARFRALGDEWRGAVADAAELFAARRIAADVVGLDANRLPALGTVLAARDAARRVARPGWEQAEDGHLAGMREYHPAAPAPRAQCSEMTAFLRSLRVHNWSIEALRPLGSAEGRRRAAKREREEGAVESVETKEKAKDPITQVVEMVEVKEGEEKEGEKKEEEEEKEEEAEDDGWLYIAQTHEEERRMRLEFHRSRRRRSRNWVHNIPTGNQQENAEEDGWSSASIGSE